jgi:hypothetical protein
MENTYILQLYLVSMGIFYILFLSKFMFGMRLGFLTFNEIGLLN